MIPNVLTTKPASCTNVRTYAGQEIPVGEMLSARPWVIEKSASVQLAGLVILKLSASNVGFSFLCQKVVSNYPYQIPRKNLTVPFLFR